MAGENATGGNRVGCSREETREQGEEERGGRGQGGATRPGRGHEGAGLLLRRGGGAPAQLSLARVRLRLLSGRFLCGPAGP